MKNILPKISVVLSFYNEERILPDLISRQRAVFRQLIEDKIVSSYELVFINDNSTDRSEEYIRSQIAQGDILLINTSRNFGVSECIMAGMSQASGDAVIYMETDLQDPPEVIPDMIKAWLSDPDAEIVYTTRIRREGEHPLKLLITKIGYRLINWMSDIELPVDSGDFKLLSRRAVDHLLNLSENSPYVRGLVSWIGFKQIQVFYTRAARFDGRHNTKMPVLSKRVLYYWLDRALISFSDAPLKLMLLFGFCLSFVSLSYILVVLVQKFMGWYTPGWPALMAAILLLGGIQMIMLGVIGLYIGSIFREVKRRPRYIIKDIVKKE